MKNLLCACFTIMMSGCSLMNNHIEKGADKIAEGITQYCNNTDAATRKKLRDKINGDESGNKIVITCK